MLERYDGVLRAPLEAVVEEAGQAYVYVQAGEGYEKRPVELGPRSNTHVAIRNGLNPGEVIALEVPAETP